MSHRSLFSVVDSKMADVSRLCIDFCFGESEKERDRESEYVCEGGEE